ncbi:MAG TPA: hypothetical protein PKX06_02930 [Phenylobacterium sp.]|nr:hypothetical protein [Phenylobacterium sp.]
MSQPKTFAHATCLYSEEAPKGQIFAAGELHPGEGWQDSPEGLEQPDEDRNTWGQALNGGESPGAIAALQIALDEANDQIDGLLKEKDRIVDAAQVEIDRLTDENAALKSEISKVDGDKDGKVGGTTPKAKA